jgi:histidinol-phosphate aminotransferase
VLHTQRVILDTDRTVIGLRTFSKFHGLAALPLGYAMAKPAVADLVSRLGHLFNVSVVSEAAAVAALEDKAFNEDVRRRVTQERSRIQQALADLGLDYVPSQASFVLAECPCDHERFFRRFEEEGIYLSRGGFFADKYIGFPIATEEQNTRNLEILRSLV